MTAIRKVLTKTDAIAEAYHIAKTLARNPDHPAHAEITGVWHEEEWAGNWKNTDYRIWGPNFEIGARRTKHRDGRIRNATSILENSLAFALFCITHFPDRPRSRIWRERIEDERLLRGTLEKSVRQYLVMPDNLTVPEIVVAVRVAILLGKVSA